MRFNFKKITALATSVLLTGMSVGVAAAANYPAPFVSGDSASVAIVYGTGPGVSSLDLIQAGNIQTDLQSELGTDGSGETTVSGEAYALFTSSRKLYMNNSLNAVKSSLTDSQLPTVLADSEFEGNVNADVTQTIKIGSYSRLDFDKHPSSDDDPTVAVNIGQTAGNYLYNATVSFNRAVNLTSSDSIGEELTIFGQKYTVGGGTTNSTLYLYKSSETISLSIGGSDPSSTTVTVDGEEYTVELIAASDTAATLKVTDSDGNSESREITEIDSGGTSKSVQGVDVLVNLADEDTATNRLTAEITVGADKLKLVDNNEVRVGSDEDLIDGTNIVEASGNGWSATTGFTIQIYVEDSDENALIEGGTFTDPVFESFKLDFSGLNIATMDSDDREMIEVKNSGDDKATLKFTSHSGDEETVNWYYNASTNAKLADGSNHTINVIEGATVNESDYVMVGNEDNGYLLKMKSIVNGTDGYADDYVEFEDVMSGDIYKSDSASAEGTASLSVQGETYTVTYVDNKATSGDESVTMDYPDSSSTEKVVYPTIETSKGANLALYEPLVFDLDGSSWNGVEMKLPDGDGYTDVAIAYTGTSDNNVAWTIGGTTLNTTATATADLGVPFKIGQLWYNMTATGANESTLYLLAPENNATINEPSIVLFEEQDDSSNQLYNALIVEMEGAGTSADGVGVSDVKYTWNADGSWNENVRESDDDLYDSFDYYGTLATTDHSESSQKTAVISYPDDQVYAEVYVAEESASITSSGSSSALGEVLVKDSEVSSVATKNLIVVGGSCINSAAATLLGGAYCGSDFTSATGVGSGQFLIKGYASNDLTSKLALLVAGYDAADTVNAATYLRTQTVDTSSEYMGTSSTSAELVVE
jgi:hypothetical protein